LALLALSPAVITFFLVAFVDLKNEAIFGFANEIIEAASQKLKLKMASKETQTVQTEKKCRVSMN